MEKRVTYATVWNVDKGNAVLIPVTGMNENVQLISVTKDFNKDLKLVLKPLLTLQHILSITYF